MSFLISIRFREEKTENMKVFQVSLVLTYNVMFYCSKILIIKIFKSWFAYVCIRSTSNFFISSANARKKGT
jgi:hypothetical protein